MLPEDFDKSSHQLHILSKSLFLDFLKILIDQEFQETILDVIFYGKIPYVLSFA